MDENPALRILINSMEGIVLTPEDHKALHKYIETKDEMTIFEYEYYYLAGQIMTFSYGRMLAQLKKEMLRNPFLFCLVRFLFGHFNFTSKRTWIPYILSIS